eukprot:6196262-Pleurochrysis_carterae.AAC.3
MTPHKQTYASRTCAAIEALSRQPRRSADGRARTGSRASDEIGNRGGVMYRSLPSGCCIRKRTGRSNKHWALAYVRDWPFAVPSHLPSKRSPQDVKQYTDCLGEIFIAQRTKPGRVTLDCRARHDKY